MVVLDTSVLLFWTIDPIRLSEPARAAISDADRIAVSSISIWEIALKAKRGKMILPLPVGEYVNRLSQVRELEIVAVDTQTWLENVNLDWEHRDPADRTIVALAIRLDGPLISSDEVIAGFYPQTVW